MTTVSHGYDHGRPLLPVLIGVNRPRIFSLANAGRPAPQPVQCRLLLDTGADDTYVNSDIIRALQLFPTDSIPVQTGMPGSAPFSFDVYEVEMTIHGTEQPPTRFSHDCFSVLGGDFARQGIDGLIGRDFLRFCDAAFLGGPERYELRFGPSPRPPAA